MFIYVCVSALYTALNRMDIMFDGLARQPVIKKDLQSGGGELNILSRQVKILDIVWIENPGIFLTGLWCSGNVNP
ncbi:MAG TPA: hypothetical protein VKR53_19465 [Puia sp.]|nr:hypothetical protein [Puia sp.]